MSYPYGKSLFPSTVGFDRIFSVLDELDKVNAHRSSNYPPYSIVKFDDNHYQIEVAVAGFSQEELSIESKQNELVVSGFKSKVEDDRIYLHHGLAYRNFTLSFKLADTVVVNSADIVNGVLIIKLENFIPEEKRPRLIPIGTSDQKLLTE